MYLACTARARSLTGALFGAAAALCVAGVIFDQLRDDPDTPHFRDVVSILPVPLSATQAPVDDWSPDPVTPPAGFEAVDLASLEPEARAAADAVLASQYGRVIVTFVERASFKDLMCGRQPYHVKDVPVWAVGIYVVRWPVMSGAVVGATMPPPPPRNQLVILDQSNLVSLQTFAPWPLDRAPGSQCDPPPAPAAP